MMGIISICKKFFGIGIHKNYISDADKFLRAFDKTHANSASQIREINKHKRIERLRDNPIKEDLNSKIWENF